uniref:GPS domain-containing protein n=1 Tax=Glossina pallidipes TaxID=7398 RepID=A0A1A9ZV42_GLOPL
MWKIFFLLIITSAYAQLHSYCSFCNNEGECSDDGGGKTCKCNDYFTGDTCNEMVDRCQPNPCANNGKCINFLGQFLCKCSGGFGGLKCNFEMVFTSMLLHFNHYATFGETHDFLIMTETLGERSFSLELISENYAIGLLETEIGGNGGQNQWNQSGDLRSVVDELRLKYSDKLPYTEGYYKKFRQSFWTEGRIKIILQTYDSETGQNSFFRNEYSLYVIKPAKIGCTPRLEFLHGSNPLEPLDVDIDRFNNFEAVIKKRCYTDSTLMYSWSIYNSIGVRELYDFGNTEQPLLKVSPYRLWFHYRGEVMASYRIQVLITEKLKKFKAVAQERCFIIVSTKPVFARIAGGEEREVGAQQKFLLDGSKSRDFALAPEASQDMFYRWSCTPDDGDTHNEECALDMGSDMQLLVTASALQVRKSYTFHLEVNSKVNVGETHTVQQRVTIVEAEQLFIDIECIRNCARNQYVIDRFIHLRAQCVRCRQCVSSSYKWFLNDKLLDEEKEERLIYTPNAEDTKLQFVADVVCNDIYGRGSLKMMQNECPKNGKCTIKPTDGTAFETDFEISCQNYNDPDGPLNYQFMAGNYSLDRTNDPKTRVRLPPTDTIIIIVCDQFEACSEAKLEVTVQSLSDVNTYLSPKQRTLWKLFKDNNISAALVLIKTLTASLNEEGTRIADMMIEEMVNVDLHNLLRVEQMITIIRDLSENLKPLDNEKSLVFSKYFQKLYQGFDNVFKDQEIKELSESSYRKASKELLNLLDDFSQAWESIPKVQVLQLKSVTSDDPLAEDYEEFPDFDVKALARIENWLRSAEELFKSVECIGLAAVNMHEPAEAPFRVDLGSLKFQTEAIDLFKANQIEIREETVYLKISNETLKDLANEFKGEKAVLQVGLLKRNPFWWFPDNYGIDSHIIHFSVFGKESNLKKLVALGNPLELKINLNISDVEQEANTITGHVKNYLHMPLFTVEVPGHSVLIVTFLNTSTDLMFGLKVDKPPRSYELLNAKNIISADNVNGNQNVFIDNPWDDIRSIYLAVRAVNDIKEKSNFSFTTRVQQCLMWDFEQTDPQWSTGPCKTIPASQEEIVCHCYHLSIFAGKSYSTVANEDLDDNMLLENLGFNWFILGFYMLLLVFYGLILLYSTFRSRRHKQILITSIRNKHYDIQVSIFTGGHMNSSSTANVTLRFVSQCPPYTVTIYQNPVKPLLRQNTVTKVYMSSAYIKFPTKLVISQDQSGRFPTWYCKKVVMENFITREKQVYLVDRWISQRTVEIDPAADDRTWRQRYCANLALIYKNWYLFQPFLGPVQYEDLRLTYRTYIWISQISVTVCVVACFFSSTSMESYEEERERYRTLTFHFFEILWLGIVCHLINFVIYLMFRIYWTTAIGISIWALMWISKLTLNRYFSDSISIGFETTYLQWNNTFPSVTFCLLKNRSTTIIQEYVKGQNIPYKVSESNFVRTLQDYIFSNPNNVYFKTSSCDGLNSTCGVDILQTRKKLFATSCEEFMFNVSYLNIPHKNCSDIFKFHELEMGYCFVANNLIDAASYEELPLKFGAHDTDYSLKLYLKVGFIWKYEMYVNSPENLPHFDSVTYDVLSDPTVYLFNVEEYHNDIAVRHEPITSRLCKFPEEKDEGSPWHYR